MKVRWSTSAAHEVCDELPASWWSRERWAARWRKLTEGYDL